MPFEIINAVIGIVVGVLAGYIGWKELTVWSTEEMVESGLSRFLKKSNLTKLADLIIIIIAGIGIISGIFLVITALIGGDVVITIPLGCAGVIIGWRLLQKNSEGNFQAAIIIVASLSVLLLLWFFLVWLSRALIRLFFLSLFI